MDIWYIYTVAVVGILGLAFGSFLNCAAMRICREEDFIHGRSRCPNCSHELGPLELIPVISYLSLRGRCRWCKSRISVRYPISELAFCLLLEGILLRYGIGVVWLRDAALTGALFTAALVDMEIMRIPDGCIIAGLIFWILTLPFMGYGLVRTAVFLASGAGCAAFMLLMAYLVERFLGREALGGGDIKLFALLGLYLGPLGAYWLILASSITGLLMAGALKAAKAYDSRGAMPFGPAICLSGYLLLLFTDNISFWYTNTFLG